MKTITRFSSFLLLLLIAIIVILNISNTISLETSFFSLKVNLGFLILFCAIAGSFATILLTSSFSKTREEKDKLKKQIHKEKLNYETESEKVKQLEAKINTLEEALKAATRGS